MSLNLIQDALTATPDKPALVFDGASTSYRDLADAVDRSARRLRSLGVSPGDRVAIFMRNRPEVVELSGVVGSPDARLGAIVHAFVELRHGLASPPTAEDLRAFAAERLAAYKVPDRWTFVTELPRNQIGKIDRHALHVRAIELDAAPPGTQASSTAP